MSRFTWNSPSNGRLINRYVDMMCEDFPSIMRQVAKKGIKGNLGSWFDGWNKPAAEATCGCLVGTTCIIAIEKFNHLSPEQKRTSDAALLLYDLVVRKSKRDVSMYSRPDYSTHVDTTNTYDLPYDPLLRLIFKAGIAAADEAELENRYDIEDDDERDRAIEARHKAVVDHIEHRIRTKLDMPYMKRGRKRDSK